MSSSFLLAMLRDPVAVGSVWPSGPALARDMVEAASLGRCDVVVEIGAGTGPITAELAARCSRVIALEPDPVLAAVARARCPSVEVVEALAEELPAVLAARALGRVDRIVSGLPFAIWSAPRQRAALDGIVGGLARDGVFVTFTYAHSPMLPAGRRFRRTLEQRFERVEARPIVWRNTPPALVYRAAGPR